MSVECYKTYSYLNKLLHSIIIPVHSFSILDGSNPKWRATYYHRRFRQQIHHPVHSDIRQPFIGLYPFLIMKKPNKTASDLTACSIPTHAVMMHITKTSLENWKRKVIPEIFSTDNSNSFHISNWCQYTTNWCWYWWFQVFWISYFTWDIFDGMENNSIHTAEENKSHRTLHLTIKMDIDIKKLSCFIVPGDRKRKPTIIV